MSMSATPIAIATPLDPLLKHLKKRYGDRAGPRDVLGVISKRGLDGSLKAAASAAEEDHAPEVHDGYYWHPPSSLDNETRAATTITTNDDDTHIAHLLRTTPHLRHLTDAPTSAIAASHHHHHHPLHLFLSDATSTTSTSTTDPPSPLLLPALTTTCTHLSTFLSILSDEIPHQFPTIETHVYSTLFSLVHSKDDPIEHRLSGVMALSSLLSVPSFDSDKKIIRIGNNLSHALKEKGSYEWYHSIAVGIGKICGSSHNDTRVEFELNRSLEWLRSDKVWRRLASVLVLRELSGRCGSQFYGKIYGGSHHSSGSGGGGASGSIGVGGVSGFGEMNEKGKEFLESIFTVVKDDSLIVRVCAADALEGCLEVLMERRGEWMIGPLCGLFREVMNGLLGTTTLDSRGGGGGSGSWTNDADTIQDESETKKKKKTLGLSSLMNYTHRKKGLYDDKTASNAHGSLLAVSAFLKHAKNFMMPRIDEVCRAVLTFIHHPHPLLQLQVLRLLPALARQHPPTFTMRYLTRSLDFMIRMARCIPEPRGVDMRPTAFASIGAVYLALKGEEWPQVTIVDMGGVGAVSSSATVTTTTSNQEEEDRQYHFVELKDESDLHSKMEQVFVMISENLQKNQPNAIGSRSEVLDCLSNMAEALGEMAVPYIPDLVENLFQFGGLCENVITCLRSIATSIPSEQSYIEKRLLNEISICLTGTKSLDIMSNLFFGEEGGGGGGVNVVRPALTFVEESSAAMNSGGFVSSAPSSSVPSPPSLTKTNNFMSSMSLSSMNPVLRPKQTCPPEHLFHTTASSEPPNMKTDRPKKNSSTIINTSEQPDVVSKLVLSLRTLRTVGVSYLFKNEHSMLLPFLQQVISRYLAHPASAVRKEAAMTCCRLLLPLKRPNSVDRMDNTSLLMFELSADSASIVEEVLQQLVKLGTSDSSPVVRLCIIRGLDERYHPYLCQQNLLSPLFLMLEDEALAVRACTLQLLGRLARLNPALILPVLRKLLVGLIIELGCGAGNSVGRETAARLIVVFLREESLQRLVMPVVPSIIDSLPISNVAPRLVSISLEALGELATVAHGSINPWLQQLIPHILNNMLDQNSSKQCISLSTMGKIAFGTGYVITPYLEYPHLLSQASDILPTTKRAPWELRREVFRLFGILGAVDPDRMGSNSYKVRGGRVGGGYFVDFEEEDEYVPVKQQHTLAVSSSPKNYLSTPDYSGKGGAFMGRNVSSSMPDVRASAVESNKLPADGTNYKSSDDDEPAHLYMYEQYAMTSQPLSVISSRRRLVPSDDDFYPTVAIAALMRILKNQSLSNLHAMVMKAVMFIFNALGIQSVPFLKQIVPHIISTIKNSDQPGIREALLQQLTSLSSIVREHLRPYLPSIFEVVEEFWFSRHLSSLCTLVERVATAVPDDIREFVPLLVRLILSSIEDIDTSEWSNSTNSSSEMDRLMVLLKFTRQCMRHEFFHLLIPALVRLADSLVNPEPDGKKRKIHISPLNNTSRSMITVETIVTVSLLLQSAESNNTGDHSVAGSNSLPSRVVQPFLRLLGGDVIPNKAVGSAMVDCICICIRQLGYGRWMSFYHATARDTINAWQARVGIERTPFTDGEGTGDATTDRSHLSSPLDLYDEVVGLWLGSSEDGSRSEFERSRASEASLAGMVDRLRPKESPNPSFIQSVTTAATSHWSINIEKLQKSWDVSQKNSREDYDEWMRRFSVQLLQEAPSAALRACAELAASYPPLARELFSSAFVCCWADLNEQSRNSLVHSLQHVFVSDASLEILQLLLNLAEFIEHDVQKGAKDGLPIKINVLAELAIKCRAYSKALHYKELEYIKERSGSCVEYLIDINKKLDLPEAALGVLKAAKIELERRGSPVFTSHNRSNSRDTKNLAYSVLLTDGSTTTRNQNSWAGNVMYETWLTKLGSWAEAVSMYEQKLTENPYDVNSILGCMHCYGARGDWQRCLNLAEMSWPTISSEWQPIALEPTPQLPEPSKNMSENLQRALKLCAQASWRLGRWDLLESYTTQLVQGHEESQGSRHLTATTRGRNTTDIDFDSHFYRSVLHVHRSEWDNAAKSIDFARKAMDSRFTALLSESYKRAYPSMVAAQTLSELEEIVNFRQFEARTSKTSHLHVVNRPDQNEARDHLIDVWRSRLDGCRHDAEVHSSILAIRSLVLGPTDEVDATILLAALSRQAEAFRLAERTLLDPLEKMSCDLTNGKVFGFDAPPGLQLGLVSTRDFRLELVVNGEMSVRQPYGESHAAYYNYLVQEAGSAERLLAQHKLYFAYTKHLWATDRRDEAIHRLGLLCNVVDLSSHCGAGQKDIDTLRVRCWLKYGQYKLRSNPPGEPLSDTLAADVTLSYKRATESLANDYRAWHSWALINFRLAEQLHGTDKDHNSRQNKESVLLQNHVVAAVKAFVLAISMGTKRWSASVQQDMLNLLSCLFKYGELHDVAKTINEGLVSIKIEAWLGVLPQLLARIHIKSKSIRSVLHPLLVRLGAKHPQALMYPLSVLLKSPVVERKNAAESLLNSLKAHSNDLVEEARMVSSELIRVAILWLELWHEGLEDASRLYYGEGNVSGMLDVLLPLHQQLEKGASTRREQDFLKSFGRDLSDAHNHIKEYVRLITSSGQSIPVRGGFMSDNPVSRSTYPANVEAEAALNQAWDLYYTVFRRINKQLPGMTTLELDQCSPNLYDAKNLELSVPGTYNIDGSYVKIERFITNVQVITSKQRPRKIIIRGDNGKDYVFLLKGHEDLRQDERVMQLFGLVNALLARDGRTNKHDLNIQRYAIAPLSHNAGVVGWVPHCDTLHCLIRDYREGKKMPLNAENRGMMALAPNYDSLTSMQKVEIFTEALSKTTGQGNDLYEVLWIKSTNSEEWLERRTNFTRSLAVMSMVGYILGLGDRHPSNLMLDQISGRVLHIDFGDCFEVAMHREKFPERVPFRLTRMLTRAMEVSGIEGSYRNTCEKTMSVLRDNKGSLVDMLEAFVHDPLISWRLLNQSSGELIEDDVKDAPPLTGVETSSKSEIPTLSLHNASVSAAYTSLTEPIHEDPEEDKEGDSDDDNNELNDVEPPVPLSVGPSESAQQHAKSLKMFSEMKALAANLSTSSRIQSLGGSAIDPTAHSRTNRSVRQKELLSFVDGDGDLDNEEALNEKALKVIRRVQDKLSGTDFNNTGEGADPLDVPEQVQRLIVQASSSENLCQLFIGWCAFW